MLFLFLLGRPQHGDVMENAVFGARHNWIPAPAHALEKVTSLLRAAGTSSVKCT